MDTDNLKKYLQFCYDSICNKTMEELNDLPKDKNGFIDFNELYTDHLYKKMDRLSKKHI